MKTILASLIVLFSFNALAAELSCNTSDHFEKMIFKKQHNSQSDYVVQIKTKSGVKWLPVWNEASLFAGSNLFEVDVTKVYELCGTLDMTYGLEVGSIIEYIDPATIPAVSAACEKWMKKAEAGGQTDSDRELDQLVAAGRLTSHNANLYRGINGDVINEAEAKCFALGKDSNLSISHRARQARETFNR